MFAVARCRSQGRLMIYRVTDVMFCFSARLTCHVTGPNLYLPARLTCRMFAISYCRSQRRLMIYRVTDVTRC